MSQRYHKLPDKTDLWIDIEAAPRTGASVIARAIDCMGVYRLPFRIRFDKKLNDFVNASTGDAILIKLHSWKED